MDIEYYREQIDAIDREMLRIFNQRAALALEIGHIKKQQNLKIYDPEREKRIFKAMQEANPGPLENDAIVRLFERVIDESRHLERVRAKGV